MSIVDVAKRAGVSVSTVSRVINHHSGVSRETEAKVRAAMEELGYVPPAPACRRGPKRANGRRLDDGMLLLVLSRRHHHALDGNGLLTQLQAGFHEAAAEHGAAICVATCSEDGTLRLPRRSAPFAAALIMHPRISQRCLNAIGTIPKIHVMAPAIDRPMLWDVVEPDNQGAGRLAAEYLLSRGHDRVAVINPYCCWASAMARVTGFTATATRAGISVQCFDDVRCRMSTQHAALPDTARHTAVCRDLTQSLLQSVPLPGGVFVTGDPMAAVVFRTLSQAGVSVGEDIELVSCNNDQTVLGTLDPKPMTFDLRPYDVGRQAVELAVARCSGHLALPPVRLSIPPLPVPPS